ncbi:MAG: hypothetical protein OEZ01_18440, partial [Candidatus Heimdallarchaeota archaeon]|nr:hypothetical protein [Candidatus Heimdallarchaeota archaeon]
MAKLSVIKLPNGTTIEVSPDLSPEQITAMITALTNPQINQSMPVEEDNNEGRTFVRERSIDEIWNTSKKERVALFIRNHINETLWFNAKDIQDQQLSITGQLLLGETSAISTYLTRLFESGHLDRTKEKNSRNVLFKSNYKLLEDYPAISLDKFKELLTI